MTDVRADIVKWAKWGVDNRASFTYTEDGRRMSGVHAPGITPCICDCSAFVTYCYSWAGAPDPNGQGYNGQGYTGTLLSHGTSITKAQAVPGDVIVYGKGTGDHTALIVEAGNDPMTVSMGEQGDPNYVRVSLDGRQPQRFLRFNTVSGGPANAAPPDHYVYTPAAVAHHITILGVTVQQVQAKVGVAQDGIWGPLTNGAVIAWQKAHGLAADGIVGPLTWGKMAPAASVATPAPTPTHPVIQQGSTGPQVVVLQQKLGITADGIFGPQTNAAVRNYQQTHGLGVDGIVGPQTWGSMGV